VDLAAAEAAAAAEAVNMKSRSKIGNRSGNPAYRTSAVFRANKYLTINNSCSGSNNVSPRSFEHSENGWGRTPSVFRFQQNFKIVAQKTKMKNPASREKLDGKVQLRSQTWWQHNNAGRREGEGSIFGVEQDG